MASKRSVAILEDSRKTSVVSARVKSVVVWIVVQFGAHAEATAVVNTIRTIGVVAQWN